MRDHRHRSLIVATLLLALSGCIEERLSVELFTQVHADGTCTRRVEYLFERIDTDRGGARVVFEAEDSPLRRLHRLPSGGQWRIDEEIDEGFHRLTLDATLESPNDFDGDFFRARNPRTPPARNFVSSYTDPDGGVFEYYEVFRDPASPLAGARVLARDLAARERGFASGVLEALDRPPEGPPEDGLRRSYAELFVRPFAEDVAQLRRRPIFGPRERRGLEEALEAVELRQGDLRRAVRDLAPDLAVDDLDQAVDTTIDALGAEVLERAQESGLPLLSNGRGARLAFRATLVLPYPIRRANTCATGDTAVWEFDGQELYGRGFEMMATTASP